MTIFEWQPSAKYAEYGGCTDSDDRKRQWFDPLMGDPLPPLEEWKPLRLTQYLGEHGKRKRKPIGDAPSSGQLNLVSERAANALADILQRHALLYPVLLDDSDEPFYMVVVQTVIDALDRASASGTLKKYSGDPTHFSLLEQWVFHEDQLGDAMLFQLPDSNTATYVTEEFKQRVIDAKLKGFCLKRFFWEEKPFVS